SGSGQSFDFDANGGLYNDFSLTDTDTPNDQTLIPGLYSVSETVPAGWELTSATCVSSIADTETPGNLELDAAETITCTFTNTQQAKIIVEKTCEPADDPQEFSFVPSWTDGFDLPCGGSEESGFLSPGSGYSVSETVPDGWALDSATCDNADDPSDITLDPGETVTCTFHNIKNGKIIIEKQTIPDGATQSFTFTGDVAGSLSDGQTAMEEVAPGNYSSTETVPDDWTLKGIVCDDDDSSGTDETANFVVAAGEEVKCTFTNIKNPFITIEADDTNEVNDDHTFTIFVGQDGGGGPEGIAGVEVTVTFSPSDPGTITGNPCTTDVNGECEVTINSSVAGVFTATASATVDIMGVQFPISTDDTGENSGPATKTYVDAKINITPQEAANAVNDPHEITAAVMVNDGGGFDPAPDGTTVTFSLQNSNGATASFVGGVNTCMTTGGSCSVSINSPTPGDVEIDASVDVTVGGVLLTRATDGNAGPGGSDSAEKVYVDARISIAADDTNEVG
ncbi:MAG: prealbumin-like fold domain-containing protein, partial [Gammaproteobacteria bacterium]